MNRPGVVDRFIPPDKMTASGNGGLISTTRLPYAAHAQRGDIVSIGLQDMVSLVKEA